MAYKRCLLIISLSGLSKQQQQQLSIMDYFPLFGAGIGILYNDKKKYRVSNNENRMRRKMLIKQK